MPRTAQQLLQQQAAKPAYVYELLEDILADPDVPKEHNLYAIVTDCTMPRLTRNDWMSNMRIADPSIEDMGDVELLFFARNSDLLPTPKCVGHIVRLHRMLVQQYKDRPQLIARLGPGRITAYCLFESSQDASIQPYFASSVNFTFEEEREGNVIRQLRNCITQKVLPILAGAAVGGLASHLRRIRDLDPVNMITTLPDGTERVNTFFDLCCRVLHVEDVAGSRVMFVWDGTDALPQPIITDTRQRDYMGADARIGALCRRRLPVQADNLPRLGSALPVVLLGVDDDPRWAQMALPQAGDWVKLRNVAACVIEGQIQALYRKTSKWAPWQPGREVLDLQAARDANGPVSEWAPDAAGLVATTSHPNVPLETLRQVHQASVHNQGTKHRCLVRVMDHHPGAFHHFCARRSELNLPADGEAGSFIYMFGLTLQDATGELDAAVYDEDGTTFFGGTPARELEEGRGFARKIEGAMGCLLGIASKKHGGEWMECCLKGYTVNKGQPNEARMYRVFDTQLRPHILR